MGSKDITDTFQEMSYQLYPDPKCLDMSNYQGSHLWYEIIDNNLLLTKQMTKAVDFNEYMNTLLTTLNMYSYSFIKNKLDTFMAN
jgi:hypothetical protein